MGWTHDYGDTARDRRSIGGSEAPEGGGTREHGHAHPARDVGISRILRRRARWVSARLRHPRT
ncbi:MULTISPECIES: hypothetical protein [unclassified Streptomyces]|uniref:hypothetical protein n=1 Tax=unclassified Streptomyces TaxID=2593676 RepID=UPI002E2EF6EB|nr:hypothetical protein [Streptomyces sp. NBC_01268]